MQLKQKRVWVWMRTLEMSKPVSMLMTVEFLLDLWLAFLSWPSCLAGSCCSLILRHVLLETLKSEETIDNYGMGSKY